MQGTGRIISAAASLLATVVARFATGEVTLTKMIGLGMIVAIVVDATLVRGLLVPANDAAGRPLELDGANSAGRFYRRYGIETPPTEHLPYARSRSRHAPRSRRR
jgi:trehalose monomycolate/heme transporter